MVVSLQVQIVIDSSKQFQANSNVDQRAWGSLSSSFVISSTNNLASSSSCVFKPAELGKLSSSMEAIVACNSFILLFKLVDKLVSNSAFLVSLYL